MRRDVHTRAAIAIGTLGWPLAALIATAGVQKLSPAEAAARLSGTWTINRELTSGFNAPGRRGGRGGGANFALDGAQGVSGRRHRSCSAAAAPGRPRRRMPAT